MRRFSRSLNLAVDEQAEALLKGERLVVGALRLFLECARHPNQVEGVAAGEVICPLVGRFRCPLTANDRLTSQSRVDSLGRRPTHPKDCGVHSAVEVVLCKYSLEMSSHGSLSDTETPSHLLVR